MEGSTAGRVCYKPLRARVVTSWQEALTTHSISWVYWQGVDLFFLSSPPDAARCHHCLQDHRNHDDHAITAHGQIVCLACSKLQVATTLGTFLMCACSLLLLVFSKHIGRVFSSDPAVVTLTTAAVLPLAVSLIGALNQGFQIMNSDFKRLLKRLDGEVDLPLHAAALCCHCLCFGYQTQSPEPIPLKIIAEAVVV
jgi:hypothetical protein